MSVRYSAVGWNRNKRIYDLVIVASVAAYIGVFVSIGKLAFHEPFSDEILLIRAFGTCAILMLHVILGIGPLARLDRRFLPVLYNRRHLGVATFLVALAHGTLVTGYYHGFGRVNPFVSLLTSNTNYSSVSAFPFETLGLVALVVLFLLAATSHDFWQKNLGPSVWKSLHMLVYIAYAAVVLHVALGTLQSEKSLLYVVLLAVGMTVVTSIHLATAFRERRRDIGSPAPSSALSHVPNRQDNWVDVAGLDEIPSNRAKVVCLPGCERIAVFRYGDRVSAVTNVCAHQRGPLGEGKIVDGCITCPWHGWQYMPENGQSPPPFTESISTYRVRIDGDRVLVNPKPLPPGTSVNPALIEDPVHA